jgi:hypothetical protein
MRYALDTELLGYDNLPIEALDDKNNADGFFTYRKALKQLINASKEGRDEKNKMSLFLVGIKIYGNTPETDFSVEEAALLKEEAKSYPSPLAYGRLAEFLDAPISDLSKA